MNGTGIGNLQYRIRLLPCELSIDERKQHKSTARGCTTHFEQILCGPHWYDIRMSDVLSHRMQCAICPQRTNVVGLPSCAVDAVLIRVEYSVDAQKKNFNAEPRQIKPFEAAPAKRSPRVLA